MTDYEIKRDNLLKELLSFNSYVSMFIRVLDVMMFKEGDMGAREESAPILKILKKEILDVTKIFEKAMRMQITLEEAKDSLVIYLNWSTKFIRFISVLESALTTDDKTKDELYLELNFFKNLIIIVLGKIKISESLEDLNLKKELNTLNRRQMPILQKEENKQIELINKYIGGEIDQMNIIEKLENQLNWSNKLISSIDLQNQMLKEILNK